MTQYMLPNGTGLGVMRLPGRKHPSLVKVTHDGSAIRTLASFRDLECAETANELINRIAAANGAIDETLNQNPKRNDK